METNQTNQTKFETVYFNNNKARIRQLINGSFIAEISTFSFFGKRCGWLGVDVKSPYLFHSSNSVCYSGCISSDYEKCLNALAQRGI